MALAHSSLLPPLKNLVRPALLTISRGTKIADEGISLANSYSSVFIELEKLEAFKQFFAFQEVLPLPYLYLLAQRAQAALMLQKEYSLAIPGMVHLKNHLKLLSPVTTNMAFKLDVKVEVPFKETGSLLPVFTVDFFQENVHVAHCSSYYLIKRKNKGVKTKRDTPVSEISQPSLQQEWLFEKNLGKAYAKVSDDHNPIHKSKTLARLAGFKNPIIQGWYCVSKAVQVAQEQTGNSFSEIDVSFHKPIFLAEKATFSLEARNGISHYNLMNSGTLLLAGRLS